MKDLVCEACWTKVFNSAALQTFWLRQHNEFKYNASWKDIMQNANNGYLELTISLGEASVVEDVSPKGLNQCELDFGTESSLRDWHAELDLFTERDNPAAHLITARPLQLDVGSPATYSQIRQWFNSCQTHEECPNAQIAALPTRVIEVSPLECPETPRVLTTPGVKDHYVTLSYCWGSQQEYVLTNHNIQSCERGLDISKLSRTIADAIKVTKSLGFKYLWVDALCIIQDSETSKTRELAVMNRIYEDASFTIVAASAACANDGFLGARTGPQQEIFKIPCRIGQDQFAAVNIQEHEQYDDLREPVNKRAWTLQEQLLSPRLLIYASHTLQWQCRTGTCNIGDSYHSPNLSSIPRLPFIDSASNVEFAFRDEARQKQVEDGRHLVLQHWMRLVISYSNRSATVPSDKLTALAGLALYFSPVLGPDYFAGIWGELFLQQLCWHSPSQTNLLTRPSQYRAPSWSWVSVDGSLYFRTYRPDSYRPYRCELVESRTTLKSKSLNFGEVTGGYLILKAVHREGRFHATRQRVTWHATAPEKQHTPNIEPEGGGYWDYARGVSDTAEDNVDGPIACLPLYTVEGMKVEKVGGLMLSALEGSLFRRIGRFVADRSDFDHIVQRDVTIV